MLLAATLLLLCQRLDPPPRVSHPGETVVVTAVGRDGSPREGIQVRVRKPNGEMSEVAVSDRDGVVRFVPGGPGTYEFQAQFPQGALVIAVYDVVERPARWVYALFLTPIGLAILIWNLGKLRRRPISYPAAS